MARRKALHVAATAGAQLALPDVGDRAELVSWATLHSSSGRTPPEAGARRLSNIQWGDVPTWITAASAVAAVVFGIRQLRQLREEHLVAENNRRADAERERRLSTEGVAAQWRAPVTPHSAEAPDGKAVWRYKFEVQNPGRLPITGVRLEMAFPVEVQRLRREAPPGDETRVLIMTTPVIVGGGTRVWERTLRISYDEARLKLRETTAQVSFLDADGVICHTSWPKQLEPNGSRPR